MVKTLSYSESMEIIDREIRYHLGIGESWANRRWRALAGSKACLAYVPSDERHIKASHIALNAMGKTDVLEEIHDEMKEYIPSCERRNYVF